MDKRNTAYFETDAGVLKITQVGEEALDQLMALFQEVSDWLLSRGIRQWRRMHTDEGRAYVAARFATDDVYLVYQDEAPVATFAIRWQETTLWGDAGTDGQAGYLHGFAVSRNVGGQGIGKALMAWVETQIAARGRRYLRLNTAAGNPGICQYYERAGFHSCGMVPHVIGGMTQLYEREIAVEKSK
ncbi:MAG TPA: GNAT family N-acetyltransferase [Armatimonadota bacterium]|jgi:ribosomal protein S18 acetylase RimI-like enzyme